MTEQNDSEAEGVQPYDDATTEGLYRPMHPEAAVTLREKRYFIEVARYTDNNNVALSLVDRWGQPQLRATVNIEPLPDQLVYIKDYSENRGVAAALHKLIAPTGLHTHSGAVRIKQYKLGSILSAMVAEVPRHELELVPEENDPAPPVEAEPDPAPGMLTDSQRDIASRLGADDIPELEPKDPDAA